MTMPPEPAPRRRLAWTIEGPDVLGATGAILVVVGCAAFHWALALVAIGLGLCGLAWRLSRP